MRSIMALCALAVVGLSQRASAQIHSVYRKPDFDPLAQQTVAQLFAGVPLDSARTATAIQIVATSARSQFSLAPLDTDFRTKLLSLTERRNSSLLALVTTSADSARFAANEKTVDSYMRAHMQSKPQLPR